MLLTKLKGPRVYSQSTRTGYGAMDKTTLEWTPETSGMLPRQFRKPNLENKLYPYKNKEKLKQVLIDVYYKNYNLFI